ncbi:MAG: D-inositol-3-phosphate glycosyltransferase [Phycisphaerae bacterium]|nr:D-inositol-3-phosphate glycosyltransferase [Phycisphaerae bacterium]
MRIGVYPVLKRHDGGTYQYTVATLDVLRDWSVGAIDGLPPCDHSFTVFAQNTEAPELQSLPRGRWRVVSFRPPTSPAGSAPEHRPDPDLVRPQGDMRAWMTACGVGMMVYPSPHRLSFEAGVPYLMPIHDLQHRLLPQFPEVRIDGEWERREYLFRNGVRHAEILLADSETGREDILRCYGRYGATKERIHVASYSPVCTEPPVEARLRCGEVLQRLNLPPRYFFYPAQFWPHKNHLRLIAALAVLEREHGIRAPLALTGAATGSLREAALADVRRAATELNVADRVHLPGYVSDADLAALYTSAAALVMPTFFGPTNLPVLEAWTLGCPVVTSDIRGVREQAGDAALLVDPRSVESIAAGLELVWTNDAVREALIARGRQRLRVFTRDQFARRLVNAVEAAVERVEARRMKNNREEALCLAR